MAYQTPYGMHDILPEEQPHWEKLLTCFARTARAFGFERLDTPILEYAAVFQKGVGQGTDIVDKEMYVFKDKGGDMLALRPEFTASVVRSYLECGMRSRPQPVKLWSVGPLFRRDRPGAGRYRQFHQVNGEIIGTDDPAADAELLAMACAFARDLGLSSATLSLNSTGCPACKPPYLEQLVVFLRERRDRLGELDRERIERNPLRVLDSKEQGTQEALGGVPLLRDYLCDGCRAHHEEVTRLIGRIGIAFREEPKLVRGLDYYTRTVFEIACDRLPEVGTVLGGGRYDGLAEILGGPSTPGVGFAGGIERLILALKAEEEKPTARERADVFIAYIGGGTKKVAFGLAQELRAAGLAAMIALGKGGLKAQMKLGDRTGARFTVIVGEGELAEGNVQLRDMRGSTQELVALDAVVREIAARLAGKSSC
jgi:histidyl-tRNA synthetase